MKLLMKFLDDVLRMVVAVGSSYLMLFTFKLPTMQQWTVAAIIGVFLFWVQKIHKQLEKIAKRSKEFNVKVSVHSIKKIQEQIEQS